ncbi:MAG: rod shape-determining protein MreC [Chitinophagaceae bacterium]|nr:rod shape-determining protein MreC [Chitinophagaceae bacterium]
MRNIFLFIRRYSTFLLFFILQAFSIYLIVHYNKYHNAIFSNTANQFTGKINTQYNKIEDYFSLRKTNDSLVIANERLYNKLKENYQLPDSANKLVVDSIKVDSLVKFKKYNYMQATVVANSVVSQNNYIVISRGKNQQVKVGMGVVDETNAVVGIVKDVSDDYAVVMSLLHKQDSHISGKLFKTGETGTVVWNGEQPNILQLSDIPKSVKVANGDSIITSGFSTSFPKGMMIGVVTAVTPEKSNSLLAPIFYQYFNSAGRSRYQLRRTVNKKHGRFYTVRCFCSRTYYHSSCMAIFVRSLASR